MKRMPLIMVVTVGVTGLFGAGRALAQGQMMGSSSGGASSSGGGVSVGGWTGAPTAKEKTGTGLGGPPTAANKGATTTVASKGSATTAAPASSKGGATSATAPAPGPSKAGATPADARGQTNVGGILPMVMSGADSRVEVKNLDNGVTLTITSADPAMATRLKKMAEAMRLMNEAMRP